MDDLTLVQRLVEAATGGDWPVAVGCGLLILCAVTRLVTLDRLAASIEDIVSAVAAVLAAVGAQLVAGVPPLTSVLIALFAMPASRGLWALAGRLIPKRDS